MADDGTNTYLYRPSSAPIAQIADAGGKTEYLHADLIGSTRLVTSDNGVVVTSTRYDEYANPISATATTPFSIPTGTTVGSAIGYSGNLTDPDTGLVQLLLTRQRGAWLKPHSPPPE